MASFAFLLILYQLLSNVVNFSKGPFNYLCWKYSGIICWNWLTNNKGNGQLLSRAKIFSNTVSGFTEISIYVNGKLHYQWQQNSSLFFVFFAMSSCFLGNWKYKNQTQRGMCQCVKTAFYPLHLFFFKRSE